jgi:transposase
MKITMVGVDLAKNVLQVHGVDERGKAVLRKQLRRAQVAGFFANLPPCVIGMEACASAHYWGRTLTRFGHTVRLMASQFVKPYVKTNKNDVADAEAICEAVGRPNMRFVSIKSIEQQAILSVHRVRQGFVKARTAQANQIRGLLGEFGLVIPQGIYNVAKRVPELLEDASNELPVPFRHLIDRLTKHLKELDRQVKEFEREIIAWHRSSELSCKLEKIPGIGPLAASALVASIADAHSFDNGRQVSAWLGLVPRQSSSGGKPTLLGMSKRGDAYLRTLLIHGARSAILAAKNKVDNTNGWLMNLLNRRHANIAAVAWPTRMYAPRGRYSPTGASSELTTRQHLSRHSRKHYRRERQHRRTHHRLLRRSSSDGETG